MNDSLCLYVILVAALTAGSFLIIKRLRLLTDWEVNSHRNGTRRSIIGLIVTCKPNNGNIKTQN